MSLGSLVWRHYVQQQPLTVLPAKAKADFARAASFPIERCQLCLQDTSGYSVKWHWQAAVGHWVLLCVKCCRMIDSVPRWRLSLSGPIQSDHLLIAHRMICNTFRWEHSQGKTQYSPEADQGKAIPSLTIIHFEPHWSQIEPLCWAEEPRVFHEQAAALERCRKQRSLLVFPFAHHYTYTNPLKIDHHV